MEETELDDNIETISASEDEEEDDRRHSQLIDAITSLDKKRKLHRLSQRTVPATEVSEFNFTASEGKVNLHELVGTLKHSASHGELKKQLQTVEKRNNVVKVPLPKREQEKIGRSVAYESTTTELSKWDPVVQQNRKSEQLKFPLDQPSVQLQTTDQFVRRFKPRTPLEMEIAAVLSGSQNVMTKGRELTVAEEKALKAMSLEEAKERRAELMKYRALLSYKEEKARWQKKIKSKKYHRVMRKQKLKSEKRALDEMQKNDPDGYTEKLQMLENQRIQERMSLKHRGGSKFARKQMIYAKYDDQARLSVQDMLQKSRELTQKLKVENESDDDDDDDGVAMDEEDVLNMMNSEMSSVSAADNPWMKASHLSSSRNKNPAADDITSKDVSESERYDIVKNDDDSDDDDEKEEDDSFKRNAINTRQSNDTIAQRRIIKEQAKEMARSENDKDEEKEELSDNEQIDKMFENLKDEEVPENRQKKKKRKRNRKKKGREAEEKVDKGKITLLENAEDEHSEELISEGLIRKRTLEEIGGDSSDESDSKNNMSRSSTAEQVNRQKKKKQRENKRVKKTEVKEIYVDPKKLFKLETKIRQQAAADEAEDEEEDAEDGVSHEEQQRMTIAQAFEDDDVIEEFSKEKDLIKDRDKPKDIDLTLPGWGEWGGTGVTVSKKKRKRFIIKAPTGPPRKDSMLGNVIISEQKDKSISKYQVSDLPFPYTSVKQFEQSIRAPIGKTWNPESAFKQFLKPKIVTKPGTIIAPMDKSEVFKNQNKKRDADTVTGLDSGKQKKKFKGSKQK